jgi:hypothetical protein
LGALVAAERGSPLEPGERQEGLLSGGLYKTAAKANWNEGLERLEGTLLGYEEWQDDAFLGRFPRDGPKRPWPGPEGLSGAVMPPRG